MRVLFVHQNFPAQYKHLAPALAARGHEVKALTLAAPVALPGVAHHRYRLDRGTSRGIHPWAGEIETKIIRGEACARAALELKQGGFEPDVICAHPGWGEPLFLREVWPAARQLHFVEFFYGSQGLDVGFDPEFGAPDFSARCRIRMKNANNLLGLNGMDWGLSPTTWQKSTVPTAYHPRISVIHDGIDTVRVAPDGAARLELETERGLRVFTPGDELVTFVNRNLEPSRGYHRFIRGLPELLARRPQAQVLIVGGDGVSYGAKPKDGGSYKDLFLSEVADQLDLTRVHFLGRIPYARYLTLLQVSAVHVYLTYPFVLSWSMLEAMSCGALVIGSRTPPVEEVIRHGENGLLVDFFDQQALIDRMAEALAERQRFAPLRQAARETVVRRYDLATVCLPAHIELVESLAQGEFPSERRDSPLL